MSDELKVAASAANQAEAEMMCDRLLAIGIHAISQRTIGGPEWGGTGARMVLVNEPDLERARAELATPEESFTDEELAQLSDQAAREAGETDDPET
ncbi:MAG: hypothetical protein ACYDHN_15660 [Solirubrobacteraceae bacterium]